LITKTYRSHYIDDVKNLRQQVRQQSEQLQVKEERLTELTEEMKAKDEKLKLCDGFIQRSSKVYNFHFQFDGYNNFFKIFSIEN
jgi:DNA repair ATPase RecN